MICCRLNWSEGLAAAVVLLVAMASLLKAASSAPGVSTGPDGRLVYTVSPRGDRIPDFSHCGYAAGDEALPHVPVVMVVRPGEGDDTARIQAALDELARRAADPAGWRGAVLLMRGRYEVAGQLVIRASGIVLRGQGMNETGTVVVAAGPDRRALIRVVGRDDRVLHTNAMWAITDAYVPVGARGCRLRDTTGLRAGQRVVVVRPSVSAWIEQLGMQELGGGVGARWHPGSRDILWERTLVSVHDGEVTWDVPLTTALDQELGGGWLAVLEWPGRIRQVGIENLRLESGADPARPWDEDHAWHGITMESVEDAWIRRVTFRHFAGGAVLLTETTRRITVWECLSLDPVSELAGHRRETFYTAGQQTLFLQCYSERGRHDFGVGHVAAGPNAFVQCEAAEALGDSGPLESWASGVLYDNVMVDGGALTLAYRPGNHRSVGWAAANSVLWNCRASVIVCWKPPGAWNWCYGAWGAFEGNGLWQQSNEFVRPESLWLAQLRMRRGPDAALAVRLMPRSWEEATNPTMDRAREWTAAARSPATTLRHWLERLDREEPLPCDPGAAPEGTVLTETAMASARPPLEELRLINGWLAMGDRLLIGGLLKTAWWRGSRLPGQAQQSGYALTRFMPGRVGRGWTDDLEEVWHAMTAQGRPIFEHHPGLWYDRRRDDHQMVRRPDADVVGPFFEQPFARSGRGKAWDGLSRYDLTRFNPWYWNRLRAFAEGCDRNGLVLLHQHYFQHNVLEAGAHWADFPWRSANNVNGTGFPEPPLYAGEKRIFMAEPFYDVTHPVRVPLHRHYIRQCLEALRDCANVLHSVGAEFTGPESFVRFWLTTVQQWSSETGHDPWVLLSVTKDVQDAILEDASTSSGVDVIDFRYWWRTPQGEFAPPGGANLALRQFERRWQGGRPSDEDLAGMAAEYRRRFPEKAVICDFDAARWAWLCAGGSLPRLPRSTDPGLLRAVLRMRPRPDPSQPGVRVLEEPGRQYLVWCRQSTRFAPPPAGAHWECRRLDLDTGRVVERRSISSGAGVDLAGPGVWWWTRLEDGEEKPSEAGD